MTDGGPRPADRAPSDEAPDARPFLAAFPAAVFAVGPDDAVVWLNDAALRYAPEARGRSFPDLLDTSSRPKWDAVRTEAGAGPVDSELVLDVSPRLPHPLRCSVVRTGDTLWVAEHPGAAAALEKDEDLLSVNSELASTQRDLRRERMELARTLTELEARTTELERTNRALDDFAHVVSHDLRAPLRAIAQFSEWLEHDLAGMLSEETAEHLRLLRDRVGVLQRMVSGILAVARAGRGEVEEQELDPLDSARQAIALLDLPGSVSVEMPDSMPLVRANPAAMMQVWLNLIGNAARYGISEDGRARIRLGTVHDTVVRTFFVEDDGPGVADGMKERIWLPFHTGSSEKGTGIGLPVVRRIVESRGGAIRLVAVAPRGARFEFEWPEGAPEQSNAR